MHRDDSPIEIALLQYTSGSTGHPKGVIVTHENIIANAQAVLELPANLRIVVAPVS
jgi:long-subunit acyl-CoA synthetase (AMP-forming)